MRTALRSPLKPEYPLAVNQREGELLSIRNGLQGIHQSPLGVDLHQLFVGTFNRHL
jgi:hypothetical protein